MHTRSKKRARTQDLPVSDVRPVPPANTNILANILSALETMQADITAMKDAQLSIINTQQHLSNQQLQLSNQQRTLSAQVQGLVNRNQKFYTRLQDLPLEVIAQIFAWISLRVVLKYRRLSRTINACLLTNPYAVLKLRIPNFQRRYKDELNGVWLVLPHTYQTVLARAMNSHVKTLSGFRFVHIKKSFPESISCFTELVHIFYDTSKLKGAIPDVFGALYNLTYMDLSDNALTGTLPSTFNLLSGLRFLDLSHNRLSGCFPALPNSKLECMYINNNQFTGPIPTIFGNPHMLTELYAEHNLFSVIPDSISELAGLAYLLISGNPISSEIPPEIWKLGSLRQLGMSGCNMFGSLAGVGALQNLWSLDVSNNKLSGNVPSREIKSLQSLQKLHLSRNQFSGTAGGELDKRGMPNLKSICVDPDVQTNHASGFLQCHEEHGMVPLIVADPEPDGEHDFETDADFGSDTESDSDSE